MTFDADGPGDGEGLYGLDPHPNPLIRVMAVPWEATASYGRGTSAGPDAIVRASQQVDLEDLEYGPIWRGGIQMVPMETDISMLNQQACELAIPIIDAMGVLPGHGDAARVDGLARQRDQAIHLESHRIFDSDAIPVVLGGDHSSPLGLIEAASERYQGLGLLHIDAHADLREAYLGFESSHASIMHRALGFSGVGRIVGVGYRDLGLNEIRRIEANPDRLRAFPDHRIATELAQGKPWQQVVDEIVEALPRYVHISFDIDGLDPSLCPNTGTPVPGGLQYREILVLLRSISKHRTVVSFDLCEVAPGQTGDWDANVGARILYKLAGCASASRVVPVTPMDDPSV